MTDLTRWEACARIASPWAPRTAIAAKYIRAGESVCDLGAGDQTLRKMLSARCSYLPVDCVNVHPGTFVVDFNRECRVPHADVYVALGLLEYLDDVPLFLRRLSTCAPYKLLLFSYAWAPAGEERACAGWTGTGFASMEDAALYFGQFLRDVRVLETISGQMFASGTL